MAGAAHFVQFVLIVVLSTDFRLPVTASYLAGPPGTPVSDPVVLFDIRLAWGVGLFCFLSALFHFLVASPLVLPALCRRIGGSAQLLPVGRVLTEFVGDDPS